MLIAEIRRKLPSIEDIDADDPDAIAQIRGLLRETKEDLLTADVFGVLKYLPRRPYLESVLEALALRNPASKEFQNALPKIRGIVQDLVFHFWPNYPTPGGLADGHTEPDVQISDGRTLLLFEAKLGSAFGDRQLERELAVAVNEARGRECFLVLVTPGTKAPRFVHGGDRLHAVDYLARVAGSGELPVGVSRTLAANRQRVLWVSWDAIQASLEEAHEQHRKSTGDQAESVHRAWDMLSDLKELMLLRQIQPFVGFEAVFTHQSPQHLGETSVFLQLSSTTMSDLRSDYRLANAVAVAPQPFGWRCPASPIPSSLFVFVPVGECCKRRPVDKWKWLLSIGRHKGTSTGQLNLAATLRRWPVQAFRLRLTCRPNSGCRFDLETVVDRWEIPASTTGLQTTRNMK